MYNALMTIDVEDWFQVENMKKVIRREDWNKIELRVSKNVDKILGILDGNKTKATFFILGWIANRSPELVKRIYREGHEIASHGYEHRLNNLMSTENLKEDIRKSKQLLEDIIGDRVIGYRAPSFTVSEVLINILCELEFVYDSSFFPVKFHDRYGKLNGVNDSNFTFFKVRDKLYEITVSCLNLFKQKIPFGGGGYFRLIPYPLFKKGVKKILRENNFYCFYIHPWEFDYLQPRVRNLGILNKYRHYNHLKDTESRFNKIISDYKFGSIRKFLELNTDIE